MAFTYIASAKRPDSSGANTNTIDTTGADLLVGAFGALITNTSQTDSKSNTFVELGTNADYNTTGPTEITQTYVASPTVGSGHYGTGGQVFTGLNLAAFSGAHASPLDQTNWGTSVSSTSCSTGSVTPSEGGELIVTSLCVFAAVTGLTAPTGYTLETNLDAITGYGGATVTLVATAYKIKGAGDTSAENPSWSWTGSTNAIAKIATYKAAAAAQSQAPRSMRYFRMLNT